MPRTKTTIERVNIRIPKPLMDEVDRIIEKYSELSYNRQQFVEVAVREKIEKLKFVSAGEKTKK